MSWLHYLIEANIYLGVFYLCYCLFLNRDTHYMLGRVYLIFSCVVAFVLPVTQLSMLKPVLPDMKMVAVPTQVTNAVINVQHSKLAAPVQHFTFDDAIVYIYITGAVIGLLVLLFRLRKLYILTRKNHSVYKDQYKLINLNDENTAFSFFNYLFIGSNVPQAETIIAHELVHIRQKHSIDIIFLEIMKIVNWFNPFIYLIQRSLKTIHEYIADEQTAAHEQDALAYSSFLLNNAYGIQGSSIAHSFFNYNLLKKRIIMLNKNRSGKLARLKYLAALPLCAGMLCTSTLVFSKNYGLIDLAPRKAQAIIKPVIDSAKYALKVTHVKTNISEISDIMLITDAKTGLQKIYRPKTLTDIDKAELLKNGMKVEIVTRDQAQTDTGKKRLPPPPPVPPKKVKADQIKFPPPIVKPDKPAKMPKVDQIKFPPPMVKPDKPAKKVKDQIKFPPPVVKPDKPANAQVNNMPPPPPPPPFETVYEDLIKYVFKHTRYPAIARDNNVNGHILLSLVINKDHKVTDVKVEKGIGYRCDEEAARALSTYTNTINKAPGEYKMVVTFMLVNDDNTKFYAPKPLGDDDVNVHNFIGEAVITGSIK
jgi:beta-lactamase regulating signal transducer with metallopeptidase domain